MEKIELRNSEAPLGHGHLFVIYTNKNGEEFIVRAGPGLLLVLDKIDVEIGPYTPVSRDWVPAEERSAENNRLLLSGDDLEHAYLKMAFAAQLIEQSRVDYDTLAAVSDDDSEEIVNSNTLVAAALNAAGIELSPDTLPPSASIWPPAGFQNKAALKRPVAAFLAREFNAKAEHKEPVFREVYESLEASFVAENEGRLPKLRNFTILKGEAFPDLIPEGIDWQATEQRIRELHKDDPSLAAGIISDLALAKTLRGDWEEDFRVKFGDLLVFENGHRNGPATQGKLQDRALEPVAPVIAPQEQDNSRRNDGLLEVPTFARENEEPAYRPAISDPPADRASVGTIERNTSYDRLRKLGRTPGEEALAFDDYHHHLRESFVAMDGDMEAAHLLAVRQFHRDWDVSVFAPDEEGTVMKNPVERVYPALDDKGHDYVRKDAERLLARQGIKAARWYLSPNEKTGSDWQQGATDEDGYGPRMTLVYDDEAGGRHYVTDSFQANVWGASKQKVAQEGQTSEPVELDKNVPIPAAKPVPVFSPPIPAPKPHQTG